MNSCIFNLLNCFGLCKKKETPSYEQMIMTNQTHTSDDTEILNQITDLSSNSIILEKVNDSIISITQQDDEFIII